MNPGWYINNFEFLWKRVRSKSTKCCPAEARVFQFAITSKVSIKPLSALSVTFNPLHAILGRFVEVLQSDLHKHFRFDLQFQMWNPFINAYFILLAWFFVSMCFFFSAYNVFRCLFSIRSKYLDGNSHFIHIYWWSSFSISPLEFIYTEKIVVHLAFPFHYRRLYTLNRVCKAKVDSIELKRGKSNKKQKKSNNKIMYSNIKKLKSEKWKRGRKRMESIRFEMVEWTGWKTAASNSNHSNNKSNRNRNRIVDTRASTHTYLFTLIKILTEIDGRRVYKYIHNTQ